MAENKTTDNLDALFYADASAHVVSVYKDNSVNMADDTGNLYTFDTVEAALQSGKLPPQIQDQLQVWHDL